jgi:hypothetical protein
VQGHVDRTHLTARFTLETTKDILAYGQGTYSKCGRAF